MISAIYFRPAIPLLLALIGGILLGSECQGFEFGIGSLALFSAIGIGRQIHRRQAGAIFPILLFVALGYLSITPWIQPEFPANHLIHHAGSERWNITGKIDSPPQRISKRTRFTLQVFSLTADQQTHAVSGKLRVTAVGKLPPLSVGDELRLNSRIRLLSNFKNPGGFDYQRYMAFQGIWASAYARGDRLAVTKRHRSPDFFGFSQRARHAFADLIDRSGDGAAAGAVFKALITGDRTQLTPQMRQAFNRAGVGHLLAISGLHIGIVATVAFVLFQALTVRFRPLLWGAKTRKTAALLSLLPVLVYGMIAGFSPSTQRAVIMVAIFLLTFLFESEQDPINTLSLAALIILVTDPPSLFSISFQLSFSAVFAIIYGVSSMQKRSARPKILPQESRLLRYKGKLISFFLVSLFAICGSLPLVIYYFNQISLVGLAANFVVVPLIGFVAVPLGLLALCILPLSITLALGCIKVGLAILALALEIVNFFADLPFAAIQTFTPSMLEIGCYYCMGWALLNLGDPGRNAVKESPPAAGTAVLDIRTRDIDLTRTGQKARQRVVAIFSGLWERATGTGKPVKLVIVLVLLTLSLDTCYWLYQRFWHRDLRVTVIDVGLGSASLLELPGGYTILVDGGGFADNSVFDVGQRIIAPLLWRKKIRTVDTLILSHPNSDHLNGLIYIARYFNVKNVWTNNEARDTLGYDKLMEVIAHRNINLPNFKDMPRRHYIDGVELNLLYPPSNFMVLRNKQKWRNTNNNSLVVKATLKSISILFPGDIMAEAEKELVHIAGDKITSTVLIAPHHGSSTSSSQAFLKAVDPKVVIVSSGRNNRFNFPHGVSLKRYESRGCSIWRTDISGAIRFATDGRGFTIKAMVESDFGLRVGD